MMEFNQATLQKMSVAAETIDESFWANWEHCTKDFPDTPSANLAKLTTAQAAIFLIVNRYIGGFTSDQQDEIFYEFIQKLKSVQKSLMEKPFTE